MSDTNENGDWVIETGPVSNALEGRMVRGIEALSAVWQFINPEEPDDEIVAPVSLLTFYTRDLNSTTVVLSMGGVASLISELGDFLVHSLGGAEATPTNDLTEEGLTKLINEVLDQDENGGGE